MDKKNKLLSPKNDIVFQCLFGKQKNESITRDFISKVLQKEIGELDLTQNPRLTPQYPNEKYGVVDVKAVEKETGTQFDLEMQLTSLKELPERMLYYWSRMYSSQLLRGEHYCNLKPTVLILVLKDNMNLLADLEDYHTEWMIIESIHREKILTEHLKIHIVEIQKYLENGDMGQNELKNWIEFLENPEKGGKMENKEIQKATEELEKMSSDEEMRRMAELRERWEIDRQLDIAYAKKYEKEAREKGLREGRKEGEEKGLKEGREKGREEGEEKKQKQIVIEMLKENFSIEVISKITKLSKEDIEKIKVESSS